MLSKSEQHFFYKKLGDLIRAARKRANLSQQDVADFLKLARTSIVNIEQGSQHVQLHALLEIAVLLNIDAAELLAPLYVLIDKSDPSLSEEKAINKVVGQFDDKEASSEILKGFMKFTKYKT